jgi:hypothetical protein
MQKTLSVKQAAREIDVHSNEIYSAIRGGKLRVVPGSKPHQISADSFARFQRIRQAKRVLAREERELAPIAIARAGRGDQAGPDSSERIRITSTQVTEHR